MEFEIPTKAYFKAYVIHRHGPTGFAVGEAKKRCYGRKRHGSIQRNIVIIFVLMIFFSGKEKMTTRDDERMIKLVF